MPTNYRRERLENLRRFPDAPQGINLFEWILLAAAGLRRGQKGEIETRKALHKASLPPRDKGI